MSTFCIACFSSYLPEISCYMKLLLVLFILGSAIALSGQSQAKIFAAKELSTDEVETSIALMPNRKIAYVSRHNGQWGQSNNPPSKIYEYHKRKGKWVFIGMAPFSSADMEGADGDIFISHDGKKALFTSSRPYPGKAGNGRDIWLSEWEENTWGEPIVLQQISSPSYEASPVLDELGNLYFTSMREGGQGLGDIYKSAWKDGQWETPQAISALNGPSGEWNVLIDPKGKWIIFESSGRPEGKSNYGDLYLSYYKNGQWTSPKNLAQINTTGSQLNPRIFKNKLLFLSTKTLESTNCDIYQIKLKSILK